MGIQPKHGLWIAPIFWKKWKFRLRHLYSNWTKMWVSILPYDLVLHSNRTRCSLSLSHWNGMKWLNLWFLFPNLETLQSLKHKSALHTQNPNGLVICAWWEVYSSNNIYIYMFFDTPRKFNIAPENRPSQTGSRLLTIIFQGRAVKFRGCNFDGQWQLS